VTGPEHYVEAERLIADACDPSGNPSIDAGTIGMSLAAAQVHATLALAAATAIQPSTFGYGQPEYTAWVAVAGVLPETAKAGDDR
jgi:hypothetical protein